MDNSEAGKFQIPPTGRDQLIFSSVDNTVTGFMFVDPHLIENLAVFIPSVYNLPQVTEFSQHDSIGYAARDSTYFSIYKDSECPDCGDFIIFDLSQGIARVDSYRLSNNSAWETLPEIAQAHRIVEKNLLTGELSNCKIGQGDMHAYTAGNYHGVNPPDHRMTVALTCDDGSHWIDVGFILHSGGAYDHQRVEYDNHAPSAPGPTDSSNALCTLIPFGVAAAAAYIWLKRKSA